ncbi:MAG: arsenite methyltransferase [Candidatus Zixiibacteriota bacterium]
MPLNKSSEEIKEAVKEHYGSAISGQTSCCGPQTFDPKAARRFAEMAGYSENELAAMPEGVTSFGCGNPVNFIDVTKGQTVLDLGSGSGLDLILASSKVGTQGKVIGLDMTPQMIDVCKENLKAAGVTNAEVRIGEMEKMPVADCETDWIISNCVINLSPEKEKVFAEALRVLKPGGRMLVSDIVTLNLSDELRDNITAWVGCIAGAVEEDEYIRLAREAGFEDVAIIDKLVYDGPSLKALANDACGCGPNDVALTTAVVDKYAGKVATVKLSARKPE